MNNQSDPLGRFRSKPAPTVVEEDGKRYVIRNGQRIEIETLPEIPSTKPRRKVFKTEHVQVTWRWVEALEQVKTVSAYRLAMRLLAEAFKCEILGGEVILSSEVTRMPRNSKGRAARELQKLGLIQIEHRGDKQSPIVNIIY